MSAAGLRRAQYRGQLRLDAVFAPLADDVEGSVTDWLIGLDPQEPARHLSLLPDLRRRISQLVALAEPLMGGVVSATVGEALRDADAALIGAAPSAAVFAPTLAAHRPGIVEQTLSRVRRDLLSGQVARQIAHRASQYFAPWFTPRRDATGTLTRAGRVGAVASWPGQSGMASAPARGLMLTESSAANGAAVVARARRERGRVRWRLAGSHTRMDVCDTRAGVYAADQVPPYPSHARCRCVLELV